MEAQLQLFVLTWGIYPRRVLLYLAEKGLESSPLINITPVSVTDRGAMEAPGKPPGSVPILKLPDGTFITQSVAIIEYFEDVCDNPDPAHEWQMELAKSVSNRGSMRGNTAQEKARTRDILALADEASSYFTFACHKGTALFIPVEQTNALTAKLVLEYCRKNLKRLEDDYFANDSAFGDDSRFTTAHCVLYSLFQFSEELYNLDLLSEPDFPVLRNFYDVFKKRDRSRVGKMQYPEELRKFAIQWLSVE